MRFCHAVQTWSGRRVPFPCSESPAQRANAKAIATRRDRSGATNGNDYAGGAKNAGRHRHRRGPGDPARQLVVVSAGGHRHRASGPKTNRPAYAGSFVSTNLVVARALAYCPRSRMLRAAVQRKASSEGCTCLGAGRVTSAWALASGAFPSARISTGCVGVTTRSCSRARSEEVDGVDEAGLMADGDANEVMEWLPFHSDEHRQGTQIPAVCRANTVSVCHKWGTRHHSLGRFRSRRETRFLSTYLLRWTGRATWPARGWALARGKGPLLAEPVSEGEE